MNKYLFKILDFLTFKRLSKIKTVEDWLRNRFNPTEDEHVRIIKESKLTYCMICDPCYYSLDMYVDVPFSTLNSYNYQDLKYKTMFGTKAQSTFFYTNCKQCKTVYWYSYWF